MAWIALCGTYSVGQIIFPSKYRGCCPQGQNKTGQRRIIRNSSQPTDRGWESPATSRESACGLRRSERLIRTAGCVRKGSRSHVYTRPSREARKARTQGRPLVLNNASSTLSSSTTAARRRSENEQRAEPTRALILAFTGASTRVGGRSERGARTRKPNTKRDVYFRSISRSQRTQVLLCSAPDSSRSTCFAPVLFEVHHHILC